MRGVNNRVRQFINKIKSSKDAIVLIQNFGYLSLLQVAGYLFPLITMPYLARVIGVEGFGKIAFASSVITYFTTITLWGFNYTAVRDIAKNKENMKEVSNIYTNVMYARMLLMSTSFFILLILIYAIPLFYENRLLLLFSFLVIPGTVIFPDWLFQGLEKMKYITIISFFSKLIFTLLVFVFINKKSHYIYQPVLIALGQFLSGIIALFIIHKKMNVVFGRFNILEVRKIMKESFNMFVTLFFPNLYTNFSITLLGFYNGDKATGLYNAGQRFIGLFDNFSQTLSRVFFPFLARKMSKHNLYVKISGGFSILMCLFLFFSADLLVGFFYTLEFSESANVLRIMSITPFFLFLMNTYGTNYLVLIGKESVLRNIIIVCSIGGFVLSWVAIINLGYIGVAITITAVWGIRGVLTWYYANRLKKESK